MTETYYSKRRERALLRFIRVYTEEHGYPPSRREMLPTIGLRSASDAQRLVLDLERKGLVEIDPNIQRGLRITKAGMIADVEAM